MRYITKNFKLFQNEFKRQEQFLANKNLTVLITNNVEFYICGNFTYENEICTLFSTKNNNLFNKILKYLLNNDYTISFNLMENYSY